ncbi:MAG TPA: RNA methyltransferase [Aquabacterium sp.]|nr:RNA methyltransferase [Aquabacterium sp.]HRH28064.1 RNA methyltransferase [Aquabacterium sp.]
MPQIQSIISRDNPLLQRLRKLAADPSAYRKLGELWVEGDHLCSACLQRQQVVPVAVITDTAWNGLGGLAPAHDRVAHQLSLLAVQAERVIVVPEALFKGFSVLESPARLGFLLKAPGDVRIEPSLPTVVLDRLQDAGNVGTILRSASALGVRQVVAIKGTAALWSAKVMRAGMGAHWALRLVEQASVDDLAQLQVPLVATSSHADHELPDAPLPHPCAWVMGHEGQGVSDALMARCDMTVSIPQPGGEESLNVAVAASICLYESARRQHRR